MKKVLITGANGFLGQHLCNWFQNQQYDVLATGRGNSRLNNMSIAYHAVELTQPDAVADMLAQFSPDVIIHNAAMSKPDECENNRQACLDANVNTTKHLLHNFHGHLIYLSTDFVFGENGPHGENDVPAPLNFYGESKRMAEQVIAESNTVSTIVRPVFMYGKTWPGMKPTFLDWVKNSLEQGKVIKVVSDQLRTPTYVDDICNGMEAIVQKTATGIFHLAGKNILSPYQMAVHVAQVLGLNESLIENVTSATFPEPVKRAKRSGLTIDKARKELDYQPVDFETGLRLTFAVENQS